MDMKHDIVGDDMNILHFAPESCLRGYFAKRSGNYETADLFMADVDHCEDIEATTFSDATYDVVVCNHVLEHVDDRKALAEIHRVLKPGGRLIAMVPIVEGWSETYDDPSITDSSERMLHFGRHNHLRYYGSDFRLRLKDSGFEVVEYTATGADAVQYGLSRGEKVFVGCK
jgi:SAM-dependent methyltransferase